MKKSMLLATAASLVLILGACSQEETPKNEPTQQVEHTEQENTNTENTNVNENTNQENQETPEVQEATVQSVIDGYIEAGATVNSIQTNISMNQLLEKDGATQTVNSNINMNIVDEPRAIEMEMDVAGMKSKIYVVNEEAYVQSGVQWVKMPKEMYEESGLDQGTLLDDFNKIKLITNNLVLSEDETHYILTLDENGEGANEMVSILNLNADLGEGAVIEKIDHIKYVYTLDKKTYLPVKVDTEVVATVSLPGLGSVNMDMTANVSYNDVNGFDTITIPQTVIDNAVDLPQ